MIIFIPIQKFFFFNKNIVPDFLILRSCCSLRIFLFRPQLSLNKQKNFKVLRNFLVSIETKNHTY